MSKKRLFGGAVVVAVLAAASVLAMTVASAKPAKQHATPSSSGSSPSSRSTSTSRSSTRRRSGTRRRRARRSSTPAARAAPTTRARSPRSRTWSPRASRASRSRRRARPCPRRSTRRSRQGVKVVLMDNDIPKWKKKSSVVATNNFNGGVLAGKYLADEAQGRRHARHPRGQSPATRRSSTASRACSRASAR